MKRFAWMVIASLLVLSLTGCCCCCSSGDKTSAQLVRNISAGPVQRETHSLRLDDVERAEVILQLVGGDLSLDGDTDELMSGEFVYNLDDLKPWIEYKAERGRGQLTIRSQLETLNMERLREEIRNEWQIHLTRQVPLSLILDVGSSGGKLALGGLRLSQFDLTTGAADLQVSFDKLNQEYMEAMHVHSGAAKLEFVGLGNGNFQELAFDGGVGTYMFDLRGDWQRSANVAIRSGVSNITLRVPHDIGVRVCPGNLKGGDYDKLTRQGDCYVNDLYAESDIKLDIHLDVGLSDLSVK